MEVCRHSRDSKAAVEVFEAMETEGVRPGVRSYTSLLKVRREKSKLAVKQGSAGGGRGRGAAGAAARVAAAAASLCRKCRSSLFPEHPPPLPAGQSVCSAASPCLDMAAAPER